MYPVVNAAPVFRVFRIALALEVTTFVAGASLKAFMLFCASSTTGPRKGAFQASGFGCAGFSQVPSGKKSKKLGCSFLGAAGALGFGALVVPVAGKSPLFFAGAVGVGVVALPAPLGSFGFGKSPN
jgi:hypothetical protein